MLSFSSGLSILSLCPQKQRDREKDIQKRNALDYLETPVKYLMSSAGNLEEKEIAVPVSEVFNEGGEIMAAIAEKLIDQGKKNADSTSKCSGLTRT